MLYRLVAFAVRQFDIGDGDIVLKINKGFAFGIRAAQGAGRNKSHGRGVVKAWGLPALLQTYNASRLRTGKPTGLNCASPGLFAHHRARSKLSAIKSARDKTRDIPAVNGFDVAV